MMEVNLADQMERLMEYHLASMMVHWKEVLKVGHLAPKKAKVTALYLATSKGLDLVQKKESPMDLLRDSMR